MDVQLPYVPVAVVVCMCMCLLVDVGAHYTISQLHYSNQFEYGLKQRDSYDNRWWQPDSTCKFSISCDPHSKYRTFDGSCNNLRHPQWGKANWPFDRFLPPVYEDGYWYPRTTGADGIRLPGPRVVSTSVHMVDSEESILKDISNLHQVWGQFLDHDLTLTPQMKVIDGKKVQCCDDYENEYGPRQYNGGPCLNIFLPHCDRYMNRRCMRFTRSQVAPRGTSCGKRHREQLNGATVFVDASQVYGSSDAKQLELREGSGGLLKTLHEDMLPETSDQSACFPVAPGDYCFKGGDPRSNEHPGLAVHHTAFLREHNRIAKELSEMNTHWDDERIYQETRKIVAAMMQVITYGEWLPILLGQEMMTFFELDLTVPFMYRPDTNPTAYNSFATAAFRYGHSQIREKWTVGNEKVPLGHMFMRPYFVLQSNGQGYDKLLQGMVSDASQKVDMSFSSGVSDHLFEKDTMPPLDLVSLNIQRGRDHGLPPYKYFKRKCSRILGKRARWSTEVYAKILRVFRSVDNVDLYSGALAELHLPGAQVGPTFACMIGLFFHRAKWGDRFWFQTKDSNIGFTQDQLRQLHKSSLARVLCDTSYMSSVQKHVFFVESDSNPLVDCDDIPSIDLSKWIEEVA